MQDICSPHYTFKNLSAYGKYSTVGHLDTSHWTAYFQGAPYLVLLGFTCGDAAVMTTNRYF